VFVITTHEKIKKWTKQKYVQVQNGFLKERYGVWYTKYVLSKEKGMWRKTMDLAETNVLFGKQRR